MNNNEIKTMELEIEYPESMQILVGVLNDNGYEVQTKPIYETKEDIDSRFKYARPSNIKPRIKGYCVKITGKIDKPVYTED